ncbi:TaqI-like C-terminal specificity domain-containing protein, partial [Helicobacter marmotae]
MSAGGGDRDIYLNAFMAAFRRDIGQYQGKIVWNRISNELCFSYDNRGYVILDSMFMITSDDESLLKYFLAVLNASVSRHWIKTNAATLGDGVYGAKIYIEKLPIPQITTSNQHIVDKIIALVEEILKLKANCAVLGAQSGGEESLKESLVANRDSSPLAGVQNDKIISLAGSQVCHSEPVKQAKN